jgi:hypothetical protein
VSTKHIMPMRDTTRNPASTDALATSVAPGFPTAAELILSELRGAIADLDQATLQHYIKPLHYFSELTGSLQQQLGAVDLHSAWVQCGWRI